MKRPAEIELVVDEVVLHGFPQDARYPFGEALELALAHELSNPMLQRALARGGEIRYVDAGAVRLPPTNTPRAVGSTVARAVAGGLRGVARASMPAATRKRP